VKIAKYLSTLSFLLALQAGFLISQAAILAPVDTLTHGHAWSPKIKPGPKPSPGGDKRPKPPLQPCYPSHRACRGGF
jgi:hypothetical protein